MTDILTQKAVITQVQIGSLTIDGLMLPNGDYAIAVPQIAEIIGTGKETASKDLKRLLGESFRPSKMKTELGNQLINVVSLLDFEIIIAKLDRAGNKAAQDFRDSLVGLSLHQLFSDAFGVKFNKEERDRWLKARQTHRKQYHSCLTNWLNVDGVKGKNYGVQVNLFKVQADVPLIPVDEYDSDDLLKLNNAEVRYDVLRRTGMNHQEAIKFLR